MKKLSHQLVDYRMEHNIPIDKPVREYTRREPKTFEISGTTYNKGLVYMIEINNSDLKYIGSTSNWMKDRIRNMIKCKEVVGTYMEASGYTYSILEEIIFKDGEKKEKLVKREYELIDAYKQSGYTLINDYVGTCILDSQYGMKLYLKNYYGSNRSEIQAKQKEYKKTDAWLNYQREYNNKRLKNNPMPSQLNTKYNPEKYKERYRTDPAYRQRMLENSHRQNEKIKNNK